MGFLRGFRWGLPTVILTGSPKVKLTRSEIQTRFLTGKPMGLWKPMGIPTQKEIPKGLPTVRRMDLLTPMEIRMGSRWDSPRAIPTGSRKAIYWRTGKDWGSHSLKAKRWLKG